MTADWCSFKREKGGAPCEERGRDWCDAHVSRATPRVVATLGSQERGRGWLFPQSRWEEPVLPPCNFALLAAATVRR